MFTGFVGASTNKRAKALLTAGIAFVGALLFFALTVYPFQFGTVESLVLVGLLMMFGIVEGVLADTSL